MHMTIFIFLTNNINNNNSYFIALEKHLRILDPIQCLQQSSEADSRLHFSVEEMKLKRSAYISWDQENEVPGLKF